MDKQINSVVRSSFFYLCLLAKTEHFLSTVDFEKAISVVVFSRMD